MWHLALLETVIGILFILGLYTQIAALGALAYTSVFLLLPARLAYPEGSTRQSLWLLFVVAFSLFITGPGIIAFDLPL
jgi:uncharacterized membrane protein YphA (DoxX/SURF4 family)